MGGRRVRHARPRDRAVGRAGDDGRHRPARLGRRRRADVRTRRRGSAGSPTTAGRSRRASRPTSCSTTRPRAATVDPSESASLSRNTPYAGHGAARPGGRHVPARHGRPSSTGSWHDAADARCWSSRTAGPSTARPTARGRDLRRGGLHHRHDRLPGDAHRPVVPPPGRRDDRAARRQHRRQRRGPGVRAGSGSAGYVVRDPARVPSQLAVAAHPRRRAARRRASSASPASTPAR